MFRDKNKKFEVTIRGNFRVKTPASTCNVTTESPLDFILEGFNLSINIGYEEAIKQVHEKIFASLDQEFVGKCLFRWGEITKEQ